MGLLLTFGPLQRVPSAILNAIQRACLDQRGNGAGNTLALGINSDSSAKDCGRVHVALDQPAIVGSAQGDTRLNWIDRWLTVSFKFDPNRDIRPGKAQDHAFARDTGLIILYTSSGNKRWALGPDLVLFVDAGGQLRFEKGLGFAYIEVTTSTQLKERS